MVPSAEIADERNQRLRHRVPGRARSGWLAEQRFASVALEKHRLGHDQPLEHLIDIPGDEHVSRLGGPARVRSAARSCRARPRCIGCSCGDRRRRGAEERVQDAARLQQAGPDAPPGPGWLADPANRTDPSTECRRWSRAVCGSRFSRNALTSLAGRRRGREIRGDVLDEDLAAEPLPEERDVLSDDRTEVQKDRRLNRRRAPPETAAGPSCCVRRRGQDGRRLWRWWCHRLRVGFSPAPVE